MTYVLACASSSASTKCHHAPLHEFHLLRVALQPAFRSEGLGIFTKDVRMVLSNGGVKANAHASSDVGASEYETSRGRVSLERDRKWTVETEGFFDHCVKVRELDGLVVLDRRGKPTVGKRGINLSPDFCELVRVLD
jgi:hypothetical protein